MKAKRTDYLSWDDYFMAVAEGRVRGRAGRTSGLKRQIMKGLLCSLFLWAGLGGILAEQASAYRPKRIDAVVYRLEFAEGIQIFGLEILRYNFKMAEGRFVAGVSFVQLPLVVKDGYVNVGQQTLACMSLGVPVVGLGYVAGKVWSPLGNVRYLGLAPLISNSHVEYRLSRSFALTAGMRTDPLIIKSHDGTQGVLFSPRIGIDFDAPTWWWNIYVTKTWFWDFNGRNEDRGFGAGITLYIQ